MSAPTRFAGTTGHPKGEVKTGLAVGQPTPTYAQPTRWEHLYTAATSGDRLFSALASARLKRFLFRNASLVHSVPECRG